MRLVFWARPRSPFPRWSAIVAAGPRSGRRVSRSRTGPRAAASNRAVSPVKEAALRLGLPVYQPERVRRPEAVEYLRALAPDAMVVVGYGQIIPQAIIDLPPLGIINVHASLLPKYRGAAPIQWAIANGETRTGVTTMRIDAGLDTGDMLLKAETAIGPDETAVDLAARLAEMGADLLCGRWPDYRHGTIRPEPQDDSQATWAPVLKKEDGLIDWDFDGFCDPQPGSGIASLARGLYHIP